MFLLGLLAVFQVTLLPGLLIICLFKSKRGFIQNLTYVFALSLLANYIGVLILTTFHLYRRSVSMLILLLEIVLFIWLYRDQLRLSISNLLQNWIIIGLRKIALFRKALHGYWEMFVRVAEGKAKKGEDFRALFIGAMSFFSLLIAIGSIAWVFLFLFRNFGTVFNAWDAWASWDPWALDWYHNQFARNTWEYPQLIPINWSITYRFIGSEVIKFFAKGIMPIFTLLLLLMTFDLGRKQSAYGYFLGAGISLYGINEFMGKYIGEGYVDLPVASLSFVAIYSLLLAKEIKDWQALKETLILGSLATAAAAVTKQPGLYILVFYPLLAYFIVLKDFGDASSKDKFRLLIQTSFLVLAIVVPWYLYTVIQIRGGEYSSNIQFVTTDIYGGLSLWERFISAVIDLGAYAYIYVLIILALPLMDKSLRLITLTVSLPYSLLWALFLSYEHRNLAIAFPLVGIAAGISLQKLLEKINLNTVRKLIPPILIITALIWGGRTFTNDYLLKMQIDRQKEIFQPEINRRLYTYFSNHDGPGIVMSPYPVGWLPGLSDYWVHERFSSYKEYQKKLREKEEIEYLLIFESAEESIYREVLGKVESGKYEQIFSVGTYTFIRINP